jgi:predicted enzyme related to lactoylglutathione lyase
MRGSAGRAWSPTAAQRPRRGGAGHASDAGAVPAPGGWNRFQLHVDDLDRTIAGLRAASVPVRTAIVGGKGGRQAVIDDPVGNPVELFEPAR